MEVEDQQLEYVLSIQYPVKFKKSYIKVQALLNSNSKVNIITPAYTAKLRVVVHFIEVEPQKIDRSMLPTSGIVLTNFQIEKKYKKRVFFKKPF